MPSPAPPLPSHIGPYPISRLIGAGSMGRVYLGHDTMIDRPVAVKTIHHDEGDGAAATRAMTRFRVEAQAAGRLNHPGIVSIYQYGEDQGCSFIAMEYVPGASLREHLQRGPRLELAETLDVMVQLLEALQFAHDRGVVHRDVKPANLIVTPEGRLKVTDFGIARMESSPVTLDATRARVVVGTPGYMAPEQYTGSEVDRRTDVFAAGVLLYQLLAQRLPFVGSEEAVMYQIVYGATPVLPADTALGGAAREALDALIARALAKAPADRFASAQALQQALLALAGDMPRDAALRPRAAAFAPPGPLPATPTGPVSSPSTRLPTGWNETTLDGLERELARFVGPVARVLVRRAARGHTSLEAVREQVAGAIDDPRARERFLHAGPTTVPGAHASTRTGSRAPDTLASGPRGPAGAALQPDDIDRIGVVLTRSLGPIAKVLVRRCAAEATGRDDLVRRLLAQLDGRVDRDAVETALWRTLLDAGANPR